MARSDVSSCVSPSQRTHSCLYPAQHWQKNPSCEKYFTSGAVHYDICHRQHAGFRFRASARWLVRNALGLVHLGRDDAICDVIWEVVLRSMHEYKRSSHDRSEHVLWEIFFLRIKMIIVCSVCMHVLLFVSWQRHCTALVCHPFSS